MSADRLVREPDHQGVCAFCGLAIEDDDQECPALDEGVCRP